MSQPPNAPGTTAASGPVPGTSERPSSSRYRSIVAARGAVPWAQRTTASRPAGQRSAGRSPPGPFRCGSTTWSVNPAATAASKALPPCSSTAIPAADASQCVEATMPKVPLSSGRVVNTAAERYLFRDKPHGAEWRQRQRRREGLIVPGDGFGLDSAHVPDARAAVEGGVGVHELHPPAADRHPHAIVVARHRREIQHTHDGELAAHEEQLLAGVRPHVRIERAEIRKLLPAVARHLVEERSLPVHDLVVRERENEVLAERVHERERQRVMVEAAIHRVLLEVRE